MNVVSIYHWRRQVSFASISPSLELLMRKEAPHVPRASQIVILFQPPFQNYQGEFPFWPDSSKAIERIFFAEVGDLSECASGSNLFDHKGNFRHSWETLVERISNKGCQLGPVRRIYRTCLDCRGRRFVSMPSRSVKVCGTSDGTALSRRDSDSCIYRENLWMMSIFSAF